MTDHIEPIDPELIGRDSTDLGTDIAIVGMAGRFPGAADVAELMALLRAGRSGITRFTEAELRANGVPADLLADPGYVRAAPVLDQTDRFDAGFFGFGPREAQLLDPQHRLFLEHSWHALEDAGCDPARFDGAIGVFGGCAISTYLTNNLAPHGLAADLSAGLANDKDSLVLRVAHAFGLTGPAYGVQSYCSTSLVAVCAAASSLAGFECDLALAGGVAVSVPQRVGYLYQQGGITPPDGECRAFDAAGLGSPLGSGVGVVVLRRLADALAARDRIYAVIQGWAVNNDGGRKVGFTAPGVAGQAEVIAEALSAAGLSPADIDYVEAHGTGTALGDAAEIAALQRVFRDRACLIGSVKTNVGHLDRAAGVTGLIKAASALRAEEIPPTRNLADPNPQLRTGTARLEVVTEPRAWPRRPARVRRAGVSAFGIGGTNAHVVLAEAPEPEPAASVVPRPELLVWSARSAAAATEAGQRLADHLAATTDRLGDIAHTLQTGRAVFEHRRALVVSTVDDAVAGLRADTVAGRTDGRTDRPVGFLIAGTGEQYPGMAADLYRTEPVFRAVLDECRAVLAEHLPGVDPLAAMLREREAGAGGLGWLLGRAEPSEAAEQTVRLQPATFAVEYALARLLLSWGLEPALLAGYSVGEYVAACLAGVLSLPDALALVAQRARLIDRLPTGAMAAVPLSGAQVLARLDQAGISGVDIAAINGPALTVVSGPAEGIDRLRAVLAEDAVPCRPLATTHAFHSAMLAPAKGPLTDWVAANIHPHAPEIPYLANVTGTLATEAQVTDPAYWAEHMCAPVRFDDVLAALLAHEDLALVELGPGQSLTAMARGHRSCAAQRWPLMVSTLPAAADQRPASTVLAEAVGRLWLAGVPIDWAGYQHGRGAVKVGLPGYPFQRERYWIDPPAGQSAEPVAPVVPVVAPADAEVAVELMRPVWTELAAQDEPLPGRVLLVAGTGGRAAEVATALAAALPDPAVSIVRSAVEAAGAVAEDTAVVYLDALDSADPDGRGVVAPIAALLDAVAGAGAELTRVLLVACGGQVVTGAEAPVPAAAAVAALPVVGNQEYLNLACRAVDLDPAWPDPVPALLAELRGGTDVLTAHRDGRRYVREFEPAGAEPTESVTVRPGGRYLITGGLGDVGLALAEHLVLAGAGQVVLAGRRGLAAGDPRQARLARLGERGAAVSAIALDVTDPDAVRACLTAQRFHGVVHAAALTAPDTFRPLRDLDAAAVATHFGAKATGALVLRDVLAELADLPGDAPDFCVLFSSTSVFLGGIAFGSYAAANAALVAIGQQAAGTTRWITASWDTWAGTLARLAGTGMGAAMTAHAMTDVAGLAAFDQLLASAAPHLLVVAGGLADRLPRPVAVGEPEELPGGQLFPRPELPQPYRPPLTPTERALAGLWSSVLGVEPVGTMDNFFDLRGNSLLALQMLAQAKKRFGITVPSVVLFEAPTVHALAALFDEQGGIGGTPATSTATKAKPAPPRVAKPVVRTETELDHRIAVVGMAGRFPGAADIGTFWRNLTGGVESITFFDRAELIAAGVDPALVDDPSYVPARPVLADISGFDAAFFGLSPRMAALTDPQQRMFLEVCWEALEQAGYVAPEHRGRVGVYGGSNISTYLLRMPPHLYESGEVSTYEIIMGNDKDALTTTVSYLFDLHGPSVAVQTFCSTSLVATHLAVRSLRAGECELAMAGGVSIRVPDRVGHQFAPGGMESPDGHVRTFDASARGSMFGDGAAVVVLKRLSDALRDGDHIWSVIRGSAMNNDGALKVGYTAPSVVGQAAVIADAMADASVTGDDIAYLEAHGTATELGDPIEVAALVRAFGDTEGRQFCPIGSVKTNIGHLDRAAGASGLIKTSLALHHGVIPPSLHYTSPNPEIDFEHSPFYVNTELSPWSTRDGRAPIAGINSLGMGGTNVHVVVEQAPVRPAAEAEPSGRRWQVLPVSARTATAVEESCTRLTEHLRATPELRLADIAFTLQVGRRTFEHRRVLVSASVADAVDGFAGPEARHRVDTVRGRRVAFVFAGVGEQYPGLVRQLYLREPVFRAALDECVAALRTALPDTDLLDLLTGVRSGGADLAALLGRGAGADDPRSAQLWRTGVAQPALFAVEYALATLLLGWGVRPALMLGYSLGEYVAACLSGVLSLPDALALVARRAELIETADPGAMAAVSRSEADLRAHYRLDRRGVDVAAVNGPAMVVVAGPVEAVDGLLADLRAAEVPCRPLPTTHAFHSRLLAGLADELTAWVRANVTLNPPTVPYLSNVTGALATEELVCDPAYWATHMCQPVRFESGVRELLADPELAVLEIGPGQSLGALVRGVDCPPDRWPLIVSTLPAAGDPRDDDTTVANCLAQLWLLGVEIDWAAHHGRGESAGETGGSRVLPGRIPLPTYPFQRQRYWIDATRAATTAPTGLPELPADLSTSAVLDLIESLPKLPEADWLYLPTWRQTAPPAEAEEAPANWLAYCRDGLAEEVVRQLRASGATVHPVRPGPRYARDGDGHTIRPGNLDDTLAVLRDLRAEGRGPDRVLHLWSIGDRTGVDEVIRDGLHTLLQLARAAGELGMSGWALDVVVAGTQEVLVGDVTNPNAALLTGPCGVIPLEYPTVGTRLIDLDPEPGPHAVAELVAELRRPVESRVALRHGRRWTPEYHRLAPPAPATGGFRDGGVYLITGGLGGIALGLATELARAHRPKLVLLARTGIDPAATDPDTRRRAEALAWLAELGAEVEIVVGDVARARDVRRAIDVALGRFGALHGVLHTAGVPGMGLMQFKRPAELDQVLAPKVAGTLAIAEALRIGAPDEVRLDLLVLFSSITSATGGGPGQVDYCAANAFLDAWAAQLAATGRPVVSVDWGEWTWNAWTAGLSGYADSLREFFTANRARIGIDFADGWRALQSVLTTGAPRIVVCSQDFPTMVRFSSRFTVDAVTGPVLAPGSGTDRHPRPDLVTFYQEPSGATEERIAGIWCDALRLAQVGSQDSFFDLGGNSLLGVTIVAALRSAFDLTELPPHILYEAPTVAALAKIVESAAAGAGPATDGAGESRVRAQLRRSGLEASAARRRGH